MLSSIKGYLFSKLVSLYFKTNGWKAITGYAVTKIVAFIATRYPEVPQEAVVEVLNWLAEGILAAGIVDRLRKNLTTPTIVSATVTRPQVVDVESTTYKTEEKK